MKKLIQKLSLLIVLLSLVLWGLNIIAGKAGSVYKDGASFICEAKRKQVRTGIVSYRKGCCNVLFMGSSRILAGIKPLLFDQLSGGRTFSHNLALPALPIGPYYFSLQDYLANNPSPEVIVLELNVNVGRNFTMFHHYANQGSSGTREILSYFNHVPDKEVVLNHLCPIRMYKYQVPGYLKNLLLNPGALKRTMKKNQEIIDRMIDQRGYYFISEGALFPDSRLPEGFGIKKNEPLQVAGEYDPYLDPYVVFFFRLAQERKIKVMLIQPAFLEGQFQQYRAMPRQFSAIMKQYGNVVVAKDGWAAKFYKGYYFSDPVHLNPEGADRFTRQIYQEFESLPIY